MKLIEREFLEPSDLFRDVIRLKLRPDWEWLCRIIGRAVNLPPDTEAVSFGAITMHTLASTFLTYRRSINELAPALLPQTEQVDKLATVLISLTVDAVERYAKQFGAAGKKLSKQSAPVRPARRVSTARRKKA